MQVDPYTVGTMPNSNMEMQTFNVRGAPFNCPPRYRLLQAIGEGAYGVVCSAVDVLTGERVAIKKIAAIADVVDCKRTLRELQLLRHFHHDNVLSLRDVYIPREQQGNVQDVYTVTELMDSDLHRIVSSGQQLSDVHVQYFAYQILRALKHIHSANVWHRDLKPSNLLVNSNCDLKIADFGLARAVGDANPALTAYVTTRWYRAPEIMLSWTEYTSAVDVWSVGCILGEILKQRPLFPGNDHVTQLQLMIDVIGSPSETDIANIPSVQGQQFARNHLMGRARVPMHQLFTTASPELCDLLDRMLEFNPNRRITVDEALSHSYLESLYSLDEEVNETSSFSFAYDDGHHSREQLKQAIWDEAQLYRRS